MIFINLIFSAIVSIQPHDSTLPALHTLRDRDIDSVVRDDRRETITVYLKHDKTYVYHPVDWDMEDNYREISPRIRESMKWFEKTFTKMEVNPSYPGGDSAWDNYMHGFCIKHSKEIKRHGPAEIWIQGIVHYKGQIVDVQVISNPGNSKLADLAVEAVKEVPAWVPAWQNGRNVVAYMKVKVKLE